MKNSNKASGFTLIEMMIALTVLAILAAITIPQYKSYIVRSNRGNIQSEMIQIASNLERYKAQQLTYTAATLALNPIYGSTTYPKVPSSSNKAQYNLTLTVANSGTTWTLLAAPVNRQAGDGALKIDNTGRRCWNPSSDADCDLALTSPSVPWSVKGK